MKAITKKERIVEITFYAEKDMVILQESLIKRIFKCLFKSAVYIGMLVLNISIASMTKYTATIFINGINFTLFSILIVQIFKAEFKK